MVGPDILNNLVSTIIEFCFGKDVVSGDIKQMFHQISASQKDRGALRFLRKENSNKVVCDYKMNVHLFGKKDSPFVANFSLKKPVQIRKISYTNQSLHPLIKIFNMDNFLKSGNSVDSLTRITKTTIPILKESGFRLTKFVSNNQVTVNLNY